MVMAGVPRQRAMLGFVFVIDAVRAGGAMLAETTRPSWRATTARQFWRVFRMVLVCRLFSDSLQSHGQSLPKTVARSQAYRSVTWLTSGAFSSILPGFAQACVQEPMMGQRPCQP